MKTFSLRIRLTLLLALAALVTLGIAAKVVDWRADSDMQQRFDASLLARAQAFAALVHGGDSGIEIDAIADRVGRFPGGATDDWYAVTCQGHVIMQTTPAPPRIAVGTFPHFADASLSDGRELRIVTLRFHPSPGEDEASIGGQANSGAATCQLSYALNREPLDDILRTLDWILLGSVLGVCAFVLILTPWLARRGLRPLAELGRAMADIGPEAPGRRLPASGTTELMPLVTRFNAVLARMDAGLARERQFASGIAHEFRTRLAELRSLVDVETRYPSGRDKQTILAEVGSIGGELESTVTALLQLTRIQSGLDLAHRESVPLALLLARLLARHEDVAQTRDVRIAFGSDCAPGFAIDTDPTLLEIVLDNLLGNAVAYVPAGGAVTLRATEDKVVVGNAAPAVERDDLANFGQQFWRKGSQGAGHAGLGLALAGTAARAMGMRLDFALRDGVLHATLLLKTG